MAQSPSTPASNDRLRGDFLLAWPFLLALGLLLVNDLFLKQRFPGAVSGVLSDVAGMVFFPVVAVAAAETAVRFLPGQQWATPAWFVVAVSATAAAFVLVKFTAWGQAGYIAITAPLVGLAGPLALGTTGAVADPWDLLALLAAPVSIAVGRAYR